MVSFSIKPGDQTDETWLPGQEEQVGDFKTFSLFLQKYNRLRILKLYNFFCHFFHFLLLLFWFLFLFFACFLGFLYLDLLSVTLDEESSGLWSLTQGNYPRLI